MRRFTWVLVTVIFLAVVVFVVFLDGLDYVQEAVEVPLMPPDSPLNYQKSVLLILPDYGQSTVNIVRSAKEIGANTIVIGFDLKTEGSTLTLTKPRTQKNDATRLIKEAYRNGMHAEVRTLQNPDSSNPTDPQEFLESAIPVMIELAKFSEENKATRFTLMGEVENEWGLAKYHDFIDMYIQTLLHETKKYYSGEIGIGFCCPITEEHNVTSFDYVMVSVNPGSGRDLDEYMRTTAEDIKETKEWAAKYGVDDVIIGEVGFLSEDDAQRFPWAKQFTMVLNEDKEAEVYDKLFEKTYRELSGYTFYYGFPILSIKGRKAELVIKEYFGILP